MKQNRKIIYASVLSGLILTGITVLQLVWFFKASEIAESNYNKRLNLAIEELKNHFKTENIEKSPNEIKSYIFQTLFIFDTDTPHFIAFDENTKSKYTTNQNNDQKYIHYDLEYAKNNQKLTLYFKPRSKIVQLNINQWLWFSSLFILIIAFSVGGFLYLFIKQRRLSEMKTDFVNMLSHEFKTPVATISLISEVLGRNNTSNSTEKIQRYAGIIQAEIARLKLLVDKTLQVASFDNKTVKLEPSEIQLNRIIQESSEYISATFENNKPEIILDLCKDSDILIADEAHLRNVFLNIFDNSCKYTEKQSKIIIKTIRENNDFLISITDNGVGIDKKNIPHIFEKFYRVSTGDVHNIKGSGLGLFYSKQIIQLHGGKISVNSSLGKGTTINLRIPVTAK